MGSSLFTWRRVARGHSSCCWVQARICGVGHQSLAQGPGLGIPRDQPDHLSDLYPKTMFFESQTPSGTQPPACNLGVAFRQLHRRIKTPDVSPIPGRGGARKPIRTSDFTRQKNRSVREISGSPCIRGEAPPASASVTDVEKERRERKKIFVVPKALRGSTVTLHLQPAQGTPLRTTG